MRGVWKTKVRFGMVTMRRACLYGLQDATGDIYSIYHFLSRRQLDENEGRNSATLSTIPITKGSSDHAGFSFSLHR